MNTSPLPLSSHLKHPNEKLSIEMESLSIEIQDDIMAAFKETGCADLSTGNARYLIQVLGQVIRGQKAKIEAYDKLTSEISSSISNLREKIKGGLW